jgi:hypothetical protein
MLFGVIRHEIRRLRKRIAVSAPLRRRKFFYVSEQLKFTKDYEYVKARARVSAAASGYGDFKC